MLDQRQNEALKTPWILAVDQTANPYEAPRALPKRRNRKVKFGRVLVWVVILALASVPIVNMIVGSTPRPLGALVIVAAIGVGLLRGKRWVHWPVGLLAAHGLVFGGYNLLVGWEDTHQVDRWLGCHMLIVCGIVTVALLFSRETAEYTAAARQALRIRQKQSRSSRRSL